MARFGTRRGSDRERKFASYVIERGGHLQVGLEPNPDPHKSNVDLVAEAATLCARTRQAARDLRRSARIARARPRGYSRGVIRYAHGAHRPECTRSAPRYFGPEQFSKQFQLVPAESLTTSRCRADRAVTLDEQPSLIRQRLNLRHVAFGAAQFRQPLEARLHRLCTGETFAVSGSRRGFPLGDHGLQRRFSQAASNRFNQGDGQFSVRIGEPVERPLGERPTERGATDAAGTRLGLTIPSASSRLNCCWTPGTEISSAFASERVVCAPRVLRIISNRSAVRSAAINVCTGAPSYCMDGSFYKRFVSKVTRRPELKQAIYCKTRGGRRCTSPLPYELEGLVRRHGATFDPHYPPSDNSDHGPMAYLAMHGLGVGFADIATFAERYRSKLVPIPPPKGSVSAETWREHIGRRESYAALLAFFEREIESTDWQAVLTRYLPSLISGWVKDAFHPLIRLGYGVEFESTSEIAAGLAYMTITGDDPALVAVAIEVVESTGQAYIDWIGSMRDPRYSRGPFNVRYQRIVDGANDLRPAAVNDDRSLEEIGRACLEVFHATHDFFALHLVTSSHAFRVCAPYAGPGLDALYSVGIAIAYLAIGAPPFEALAPAGA